MQLARFLFSSVTALCALTFFAFAAQAGNHGSKILPPGVVPYGTAMEEWAKSYSAWLITKAQGPEQFGHVLFPAAGGTVTGSGTLDDPIVLTAHADVTVKPGTSLLIPLLFWVSELYEDGSTDLVLPDEWWTDYHSLPGSLMLDGKVVVSQDDVHQYYLPPQGDPLIYPEPTPWGSIGLNATQGWFVFCKPLSVGVHQLSWSSAIMLPDDNGLFPFEIGQILNFSLTVTVQP